MKDTLYNVNMDKLFNTLDLGELTCEAERVSGGFLHQMYKVKTTKSTYAVKAVNPQIMKRSHAMGNYIFSEKVSRIAFNSGISAIPAIDIDESSIHEIDSQYYLVFPWIEATTIKSTDIDEKHSRIMGSVQGQIHSLDFTSIYGENMDEIEFIKVDWNEMTSIKDIDDEELIKLILTNTDILTNIYNKITKASERLQDNLVISHRDLDPKNVLWDGYKPIIIDWEAAGYINPGIELIQGALYWSTINENSPSKHLFQMYLYGYKESGGELPTNLQDVMYSMLRGHLGWLEYNLRRSKGIECNDKEEQLVGVTESINTIKSIITLYKQIPMFTSWVEGIDETERNNYD